jgi:hypothetical protein
MNEKNPIVVGAGTRAKLGLVSRVALVMVLLSGCATEAPLTDDPESADYVRAPEGAEEKAGEPASPAEGKHRAAPELLLRWEEPSTDHEATTLTLVAVSSAPEVITAALRLEVKSPVGDSAELDLGTVEVQPGATQKVSIPVADLPVQTEGAASMLLASASWESAVPGSTNPDDLEPALRSVSAETRFATWNGTDRAQVRSAIAQRRIARDFAERGELPKLTVLRVRDAERGVLVARDQQASGAVVLAGEGFSISGEAGPGNAPKTPVTEPVNPKAGEN